MIKQLQLVNFKGFERFRVNFSDESFLVGPNNAGKSTIIAALRVAAQMVSHAKRRPPSITADDGDLVVPAHSFPPGRFTLVEENLRHEFRQVETRLELRFRNDARLTAVWPAPTEEQPEPQGFFYITSGAGVRLRTPATARAAVPDLAVLPILSPVEHEEQRLSPDHVRVNMLSRLSSRHTRNHILMLSEQEGSDDPDRSQLEEFLDWAEPWTPDFRIGDIVVRRVDGKPFLDVFCRETGSRSEKELFWAGDGIQVWIQLLMHLFRNRHRSTIVLDEPDLYLHADLQRRMVRLLDELEPQTIAASHSAEVLVEAPPEAVVWIARDRRASVRAPTSKVSSELSGALGSQFNLRLARALRVKAVLFVEGDDMRMLRNMARTLGARRIATEAGIVAIPLRGFSNWRYVEPFSWLVNEFLDQTVRVMVILDRDYRTDEQCRDVVVALGRLNVSAHVWRRKELESYVLEPAAIARRSGADPKDIERVLEAAAESKREEVFAQQHAQRVQTEVSATRHLTDVTKAAQHDFEARWARTAERPWMCNAKDLLSAVNAWLQANGHRTVSARALSSALRRGEIEEEMAAVINQAEDMAA
ncbi:MAG: ATP-dependent nuclease [Solirubrobacteraceae bacterium]